MRRPQGQELLYVLVLPASHDQSAYRHVVSVIDLQYRRTATSEAVVFFAGRAIGKGILAILSLPSSFRMSSALLNPPSSFSMA